MRHIVRHYLVRDPAGRPLSAQSERLTDDGRGWLQLTSQRTARFCSGCRRPVTDVAELRGVCDWCGGRSCCIHCVAQCQICSRRLCGRCRRGFAGPPPLTVCSPCQHRLLRRQAIQDQLMLQQSAFEQEMARHRLFSQLQALQLASERTRIMAELQAARLGLNQPPPLLTRAASGLARGLTRGIQHVCHALR